jgi:hypothetical protein
MLEILRGLLPNQLNRRMSLKLFMEECSEIGIDCSKKDMLSLLAQIKYCKDIAITYEGKSSNVSMIFLLNDTKEVEL